MTMHTFQFYRTPHLICGAGTFSLVAEHAARFGKRCLVVTGAQSFRQSHAWQVLQEKIAAHSMHAEFVSISNEPTAENIDTIVNDAALKNTDVVIAIGGGSVLDAGKAISAMLLLNDPVEHFLEGVGTKVHPGCKVPFIAVPTTAGTGSEATKNAVISRIGAGGYKKSLRHDHFVPDIALLDPELSTNCPPQITASCGMDALTQLLESYVSIRSSIMTDSLIQMALPLVKDNLIPVSTTDGHNVTARAVMSYAAFVSGITLANAGLGLVHGFASSIGARVNIGHGTVCGTLLASVTRHTIARLRKEEDPLSPGLVKYAKAALGLCRTTETDPHPLCDQLIDTLYNFSSALAMPKLSAFGVTVHDIDPIIAETGNRNNACKLDKTDMREILQECL
jgi:alcohol dehydrogenase class IV